MCIISTLMQARLLNDILKRLAAIKLISLVLVASDQRLLRAARAEGLQIFNPKIDSQQTLVNWVS